MKDYKRLGDYIREVNVRNRELRVTKPMGINIDKHFMPSVANIIGTDLSAYKLVCKNQFACNLMHVGRDEKIPIAMHTDKKPIIVSPAYFVFEIIPVETRCSTSLHNNNELLPEYLMMWFRRAEFDRNAWFYTDADVRGGMNKDVLLDMRLPIPTIARQREIVSEYETLACRIRLNEQMIAKLEETAQALYRKMFVEGVDKENLPAGWRWGKIEEIAEIKNGKNILPVKGDVPVYGGNGIVGYTDQPNAKGIVVIGRVGVNCGSLFLHQGECYVNDNAMMAIPKDRTLIYLYWSLKQIDLNSQSEGSSQPLLTQSIIYKQECIIPNKTTRAAFDNQCQIIYKNIILLEQENAKLTELQSLLLARMGK